ncbi:MAG TPA: AtpZ/AtpI family protein [Alphaproteobacteria bacterium]|nr:AtpZ/AtpI family protein [Alphaproteobacteria bacterium]
MGKEPSATDWRMADIGIYLLVCILACGALGYATDSYFHSKPWGLLAGIALGFAAWLRQVWKMLNTKQ